MSTLFSKTFWHLCFGCGIYFKVLYSFWLFRVPPLFRGHRHVTKWFSFDMCRMRSSAECWPGALGCWGRLNWVANRWGDFFVMCYPILNESWIFGCQSKPNGSNNSNFWLIMGATSLQGSVGFQVTEDRQTQNTMDFGQVLETRSRQSMGMSSSTPIFQLLVEIFKCLYSKPLQRWRLVFFSLM